LAIYEVLETLFFINEEIFKEGNMV